MNNFWPHGSSLTLLAWSTVNLLPPMGKGPTLNTLSNGFFMANAWGYTILFTLPQCHLAGSLDTLARSHAIAFFIPFLSKVSFPPACLIHHEPGLPSNLN